MLKFSTVIVICLLSSIADTVLLAQAWTWKSCTATAGTSAEVSYRGDDYMVTYTHCLDPESRTAKVQVFIMMPLPHGARHGTKIGPEFEVSSLRPGWELDNEAMVAKALALAPEERPKG